MEWFARAFIKAALAWFAAGVTLGVAIAAHGTWIVYRPAHVHMNLLGFVTMMIYGVAFHVIPRFTGHPVHSPRLAVVQWWMANVGLLVFVSGFLVRPSSEVVGMPLVVVGGVLSALAAYAFVHNIWSTINGTRSGRRVS